MLTHLAAAVLLLFGDPLSVPRVFACDSTQHVAGMNVERLAARVAVARIDLVVPTGTTECASAVWKYIKRARSFAPFDTLASVRCYTATGEMMRTCSSAALVDSARAKGLPWESLARLLGPDADSGLEYIPVAAYLARSDSGSAWIVAKKTGIKAFNKWGFEVVRTSNDSILCGDSTW